MSKISYSAWKKYLTCGQLYDYHYNQRLRPKGISSALVFGTAIDNALNCILLKAGDPVAAFQDNFQFENLQGVEWDYRDLDMELFTAEQLEALKGQSLEYKMWASMRVKGRLMIEAYIKNVVPLIEEVKHVQKELDSRPGFLDALLVLRGYGEVLVDHKTASRPYSNDAVKTDPQLALYAGAIGVRHAGFIVLVKQIRKNRVKICSKCGVDGSNTKHKTCSKVYHGKRCHGPWDETLSPEASIQIIIDEVPANNLPLVEGSIQQVERAIDAGIYPRNLTACGWMYGKPCPYINKCWKNEEDGLEVVPKQDKEQK